MTTEKPPGLRAATRNVITSVIAANIATLPIIMWTFGEWSPISPEANLLIRPVMIATFPATYALALVGIISPSVAAWAGGYPLSVLTSPLPFPDASLP